jgi:formylglycine-generating enzyme required for sulfatase activity/ribosomal protein L40E
MMIYCERCNAEFPEGMKYCKWCGQTLVERKPSTAQVRKCPSCSTPIQEGWTFCNSCGAKVAPTGQESATPLCLRCGAMVPPGANNCLRCGERFTAERYAPQAQSPQSSPIAAAQKCLNCGEILEAGRVYCKACGTPVYPSTGNIESPYAPPANQSFSQSLTQQVPPPSLTLEEQTNAPTQPVEAIHKTLVIESQTPQPIVHTPAPPIPNAPPNQARTEVYQSFKPEEPQPPPSSTIAFHPETPAPPVVSEGAKNQPASPQGKTIEYSSFNLVSNQAILQTPEINASEGAPSETLSASDLSVEPDVFDLFETQAKPVAQVPQQQPSAELSTTDKEPEFTFEITPIEPAAKPFDAASHNEPPILTGETEAINAQETSPVNQSGTMHLELDNLPFESTVKEQTGSLNPNRATSKLSVPEVSNSAPEEVQQWQPPAPPVVPNLPPTAPPNAQAKAVESGFASTEQLPRPSEQLPMPLENQPASTQQIGNPQGFAPPPLANPQAAAWPTKSSAPAWPENQSATAPQATKKKGGFPVALVAAAVIVLGLAAAAVWWFVLRPKGDITTPNANKTVTVNSNVNPADANTNTANSNTSTTNTPATPEGMVAVAAGEYTVGRDDGDELETPKHTVALKAFFIDKTEVTNAEYKKFVDATGHKAPSYWPFKEEQANFPVVQVSWQDANDYAKWAGKRLPKEAEWEAAARGIEGRRFPWGNEWKDGLANLESKAISEVGKFVEGQSPCGALDMIGNVWEWTDDAFALYPGSIAKMPEDIDATQSYRVIRGGAFDVSRKKVNIDNSYRGYIEETRKDLTKTGFRCVKDANQ